MVMAPGHGRCPSPGHNSDEHAPGPANASARRFTPRLLRGTIESILVSESAMRCVSLVASVLLLLPGLAAAQPGKGNRLAYLDEVDPYYPSHTFPKLTTPMWVGDKDV